MSFFLFIRGKKEALPEQKNDGVPDYKAAERAWNAEKLIDKSFIRETFYAIVICISHRSNEHKTLLNFPTGSLECKTET